MEQALSGTLVVSLEQAVAAPYCSRLLQEAGARIIKIERPEGDFAREYDTAVDGESTYFVWLNSGKESIVLDLRKEEERGLLKALIRRADIFLQNLKTGAAERLGFGFKEVKELNPGIIMCSISGYGSEGEYAKMKAYDALIQAESGLCSVTGPAGYPSKVGASICDISTGLTAYGEILKALLNRNLNGSGEHIECSLFGVLSEWMSVPLLFYEYGGKLLSGTGMDHPQIAPYGTYQTADGPIFIVIQNPREWLQFCEKGIGLPELAEDPRFSTNVNRVRNRDELKTCFETIFSNMTRAEVSRKLLDAGIACGSINSVADLADHPALQRRSIDVNGKTVSTIRRTGDFSEKAMKVPRKNAHGDAIREEFKLLPVTPGFETSNPS